MQHFLLENSIFNLTNRARIVGSELIYLEKFESGLKNTSFWPGCSFLKISKSIKVNWTANSSELKSIGLWDSDTASLVIFDSCFGFTIFFFFLFLSIIISSVTIWILKNYPSLYHVCAKKWALVSLAQTAVYSVAVSKLLSRVIVIAFRKIVKRY